jgi:hypothetical protein
LVCWPLASKWFPFQDPFQPLNHHKKEKALFRSLASFPINVSPFFASLFDLSSDSFGLRGRKDFSVSFQLLRISLRTHTQKKISVGVAFLSFKLFTIGLEYLLIPSCPSCLRNRLFHLKYLCP